MPSFPKTTNYHFLQRQRLGREYHETNHDTRGNHSADGSNDHHSAHMATNWLFHGSLRRFLVVHYMQVSTTLSHRHHTDRSARGCTAGFVPRSRRCVVCCPTGRDSFTLRRPSIGSRNCNRGRVVGFQVILGRCSPATFPRLLRCLGALGRHLKFHLVVVKMLKQELTNNRNNKLYIGNRIKTNSQMTTTKKQGGKTGKKRNSRKDRKKK